MRVNLVQTEVILNPNVPVTVEVEVTNDLEVIDGLSATFVSEPGLSCTITPELLPLFPEATGQIRLELEASPTYPAGAYQIPIALHSAVEGGAGEVVLLSLTIPPLPAAELSVEPALRRARHRTSFELRLDNAGNTPLELALSASDATRSVTANFSSPIVSIAPGAFATTSLNATCRRHLFGGEMSHALNILGSAGDLEVVGRAVFRQNPIIPRGARTIVVLGMIVLLWAGIFSVVLSKAMSKDPLTKDVPASFYASTAGKANQPKLQDLGSGAAVGLTAASSGAAPAGAVPKSGVVIGVGGTIAGTVDAASTAAGIGRISVEAVQQLPSGTSTVASAATNADGTYSIEGLLPGSYKLLFEAQGFKSVWYPAATSQSAAAPVTVNALEQTSHIDVVIDGLAGSITGIVNTGVTPAAVITVTVQPQQGSTQPVATVKTNADGSYTVSNLATPGQYDLSFSGPNYLASSASDQLVGGQQFIGDTVTMIAANGSISGTVTAGGAPLGGVSITAAANGQTFTSATPTTGPVGRFSLTSLPTPATYLLTFTAAGYGTRVIGENLGPGQTLTALDVVMQGGAGGISGTVFSASGTALGGAKVVVGGGASPVSTETLTAGTVGAYSLAGLSTPGTYTLTFSLAGYESQTIAVPLASSGSAHNIDVHLPPAIGTITGTVTSAASGTPLVGVTVTATDGTNVTTTTTTSQPAGGFLLSGLAPGSYSVTFSFAGYSDQTFLVVLAPGASSTLSAQLAA